MNQDNQITDVVFRVETKGDFKGDVFAMLPHEVADRNGHVTCYQHIGQHSQADYAANIAASRPATKEEYAPLKAEMEGLGYNFKIVAKQNQDKFVASWDALRKLIG
ncbi:MAG: hypothetical protein P8J32_04580 [bacterium]|nr:hypothetical protein [bacterium]